MGLIRAPEQRQGEGAVSNTFTRATKTRSRLRMALDGPSGSGKTFTGLTFAFALAGEAGRIAVIDTERGSASKYADRFPPFDVLELETFSPELYTAAIEEAEAAGYDVLVIDSLSHAWEGEGGALEMVDKAAAQSRSNNSYTAWRAVTPVHRHMVDAILQSTTHTIVTMRSKTEYVLETNERGKQEPRKIGMAPVQRAGMEYEFDIVADLDWDHKMVVSKSRCTAVDGDVTRRPTAAWMAPVIAWLTDGAAPAPKPEPARSEPEAERVPPPEPDSEPESERVPTSQADPALYALKKAYIGTRAWFNGQLETAGLTHDEGKKYLSKALDRPLEHYYESGLTPNDALAAILHQVANEVEAEQNGKERLV